MRTDRLASRLRSAGEGLRSSPRRVWWTSFVLVALLSGLWGLTNPPFAAPDEPAHVIRAHALAHGELTGKTPSRAEAKRLKLTDRNDYLVVRAPAVYGTASDSICFVNRPSITAACLSFGGPTRDSDQGTYVARHPPAYYAVVGAVSWVVPPGSAAVYVMRLLGALMTAAFVATAITALRRSSAPAVIAAGLAVAITPMVLFVGSTVNPSVTEIAASLAFWVCGFMLITRAQIRVDNRLVTAAGIAGCVLALSRQLGPLWLGLIGLVFLGVSNRAAIQNLARSFRARLWTALIVASSLVQVGWDVVVKPLVVTRSGHSAVDTSASAILRLSTGRTFPRYREMIGTFGWLDTPAPALTWVPWTAVIGLLFFAAVLWATRREVAALLALLAAAILVPIVIESVTVADAQNLTWQGRYTLPLAVGVPILSAVLLSSTERGRQLVNRRFLLAVGALLSGAHIIAFAQNLRRYAVGYDGSLQFWSHAAWSPPLPSLLLLIAFGLVVIAFLWWLLIAVPGAASRTDPTATVHDDEVLRREKTAVMAPPRA